MLKICIRTSLEGHWPLILSIPTVYTIRIILRIVRITEFLSILIIILLFKLRRPSIIVGINIYGTIIFEFFLAILRLLLLFRRCHFFPIDYRGNFLRPYRFIYWAGSCLTMGPAASSVGIYRIGIISWI